MSLPAMLILGVVLPPAPVTDFTPAARTSTHTQVISGRRPVRRSIKEAFDPRNNSLNALRLVFSLLVIAGHAQPLAFGDDARRLGSLSYQDMPVDAFFVISGFLITSSRLRSKSTYDYLKKRFLRIYPGYWAALLVAAFIFGPLIWLRENNQSLASYFSASTENPFAYVVKNATIFVSQYNVAGLLANAPAAASINGSIWTLVYEVLAYVGVAVLAIAGVLHRRQLVTAITVVFLITYILVMSNLAFIMETTGVSHHIQDPFRFGFMFTVGASFFLWADRIPFSNRLAALSAAVLLAGGVFGSWRYYAAPAFVYLIFWLAIRLPSAVHRIGRKNDLSYGIYLYGWPAQQLLWTYGVPQYGEFVFTVAAMTIATACAGLSWRFVEAPALNYKSILSRRSVADVASAKSW